jgi:hypothetical protein
VSGMYIRLPAAYREALYQFAERQWRDPRDQAAMFVVEGLCRAGALTVDSANPASDSALRALRRQSTAGPEPDCARR